MVKRKTNSPAYHYQGHWKTMLWYRRSPKIYAKATKDIKPFDEKDPFHFLLGIDFNKDNAFPTEAFLTAYDFLHGYCDTFALALHQEFGYPLWTIDDSLTTHTFCKEGTYCIDVRGVTDDTELFSKEFDEPHNPIMFETARPVTEKEEHKIRANNEPIRIEAALRYIQQNKKMFRIPKAKPIKNETKVKPKSPYAQTWAIAKAKKILSTIYLNQTDTNTLKNVLTATPEQISSLPSNEANILFQTKDAIFPDHTLVHISVFKPINYGTPCKVSLVVTKYYNKVPQTHVYPTEELTQFLLETTTECIQKQTGTLISKQFTFQEIKYQIFFHINVSEKFLEQIPYEKRTAYNLIFPEKDK